MAESIDKATDVQPADIYETRAVAFLDILGFTDLIASGNSENEIAGLFDALKKRAEEVERASRAGRMQVTVFSDCIVVSENYLDGFGAERIAGYAAFLALDLLAKGFLVRGGLSVGQLHHRNGTVFGPALLEAYRLESKVAIFPRLVVSPDFRQAVFEHAFRKKGPQLNVQFALALATERFRVDFDGMTHIDIFGALTAGPSDFLRASGRYQDPVPGGPGVELRLGTFADAARNTVRKTRELRFKPIAAQKYDWMDRYLADSAVRHKWPEPGID